MKIEKSTSHMCAVLSAILFLPLLALMSCVSAKGSDTSVSPKDAPIAAAAAKASPAKGEVMILEDFESEDLFWEAIQSSWNDGDNSLSVSLEPAKGTHGKTALSLEYAWMNQGVLATFCCKNLELADWSGVEGVMLDVVNPADKELFLRLDVQAGDPNWTWYSGLENQVSIKPGVNKEVFFDLGKVRNESLKTTGAVDAADLQNMAGIFVRVVSGGNGIVLIDHIRLVKKQG